MPQTQDMTPPSRHSIQTRGRPVAVLSIDVERHTGIPILLSWVRSFPDLPHTPANAQLYDAVMVSRKLSRKYRTNRILNPGPVVCQSITLFARPQLLLWTFGITYFGSSRILTLVCKNIWWVLNLLPEIALPTLYSLFDRSVHMLDTFMWILSGYLR